MNEIEQLIAVTMTPEAAARFKEALLWAYVRSEATDEPSELELADWLRWGVGRIDTAMDSAAEARLFRSKNAATRRLLQGFSLDLVDTVRGTKGHDPHLPEFPPIEPDRQEANDPMTESNDSRSLANNATWTCFGCAHEQPDTDSMSQFCPKCGGVWVRPLARRVWWRRAADRLRYRKSEPWEGR